MNFSEVTVREYLSKERSALEQERVRRFLFNVVFEATQGEEKAFHQLLDIKDIRLFTNHIATKVLERFDYKIRRDVVVAEVQYSLYDFLRTYYRMTNSQNEIQTLITALYKWLPSKVTVSLYDVVVPKRDEGLSVASSRTQNVNIDYEFNLFLSETLTSSEYELFQDIYVDCKTNVQISKERNVSEGTIRYQNKKLLSKLRDELTI